MIFSVIRQGWRTILKRGRLKQKSDNPNSVARRICDFMWGNIVLRGQEVCVCCHKNLANHPHHIFCKKECPATRYELKNGLPLCGGCHKWKFHSNPEMYRHISIRFVGGPEEHDRLTAMASLTVTFRDWNLIEMTLWQDLGQGPPEEWGEWSENKKIEYLRKLRRH